MTVVTQLQSSANRASLASGRGQFGGLGRGPLREARSTIPGGLAAALVAVLLGASPAAAADATLRIDPSNVAVGRDQTFEIQVVQQAPVETSGAQISLTFDPAIVQIISIARGPGYARAPILVPDAMDAAIQAANASGRLAQVAAAFTPPDAIPVGESGFLVITLKVVGCGETDLGLPVGGPFNAQMISGRSADYGDQVPVAAAGGHVTTCVDPGAVSVAAIASNHGADVGPTLASAGVVLGLIALTLLGWRLRRQAVMPARRATSHGGSMRRR